MDMLRVCINGIQVLFIIISNASNIFFYPFTVFYGMAGRRCNVVKIK